MSRLKRPTRDGRVLSIGRASLALGVVAILAVGAAFGVNYIQKAQAVTAEDSWFAGYVDATATPTYAFEVPTSAVQKNVVLSFIVADDSDACTPSWGTAYTLDEAAHGLDLDRRLARLRAEGGQAAVSFGGLLNDELASVCTDPDELVDAYEEVIDRYEVTTIDLDIEGDDLSDTSARDRRAAAISEIQADRRASGDGLAVWLTLPAGVGGLPEAATDTVTAFLDAGVDLAGVNVMTMNYGSAADDMSMAEASIDALTATHRQLKALYKRADIELSAATLWSKIGATPMAGQNDVAGEIFTLSDAKKLNAFADENHLGRMSLWSLNRDTTCGPNYVDLTRVSDACSGIDQGDVSFAETLAVGFTGSPDSHATTVTTAEPTEPIVDDPDTSPYAIWAETSAYLKDTKIVWHGNVYQAKWWTRGDVPDDPVLNEWETPWTLIGPVLPGEEPYEAPTLPAGTYDDWSSKTEYQKGDRVLLDGIPYEAKWWNAGESPESATADPDGSAWVPLTQKEIDALLAELDK